MGERIWGELLPLRYLIIGQLWLFYDWVWIFWGIEVTLLSKEESTVHNYKNEYKQVLLNLLSNAKEALKQSAIPQPIITLTIDTNSVTVEDNAGGISKEILSRIYEPYFSTKEGNSGIGLYMSKMIVERNMGGKLTVKNTLHGALFRIEF